MCLHAMSKLMPLLLPSGCAPDHCLPLPEADRTPPAVSLAVTFTDPETGTRQMRTLTPQDSSVTILADASGDLHLAYAGADDEGMRRLQLSVTVQHTVGVGVQRRAMDLEPVEADCPLQELKGDLPVPAGRAERSLEIAVLAENWAGQRSFTPNYVVRLQHPAAAAGAPAR